MEKIIKECFSDLSGEDIVNIESKLRSQLFIYLRREIFDSDIDLVEISRHQGIDFCLKYNSRIVGIMSRHLNTDNVLSIIFSTGGCDSFVKPLILTQEFNFKNSIDYARAVNEFSKEVIFLVKKHRLIVAENYKEGERYISPDHLFKTDAWRNEGIKGKGIFIYDRKALGIILYTSKEKNELTFLPFGLYPNEVPELYKNKEVTIKYSIYP